ncbi:MAG: hypothetical protein JNM56_07350 [Planctomycetia bacterium]|nr:hypothetical protein [Planctomycetia bacterium]
MRNAGYHRLYDFLLLTMPLVYSVGQAQNERGRLRWLYTGCALALAAAVYTRLDMLKSLTDYAMQPGIVPWLVEALMLPYATWLMVAVVIGLSLAERWKSNEPEVEVLMARAEIAERPGMRRIAITRIVAEPSQAL